MNLKYFFVNRYDNFEEFKKKLRIQKHYKILFEGLRLLFHINQLSLMKNKKNTLQYKKIKTKKNKIYTK